MKHLNLFLLTPFLFSTVFAASPAQSPDDDTAGTIVRTPKLTVVCVVDQFAEHTWRKLHPHFRGGLKYLAHTGRFFSHAFYPHARPATAPGHTCLNTGAYPKQHGMISNFWHDGRSVVQCDDDSDVEKSAVISPETRKPYPHQRSGKSGSAIMAEGISTAAKKAGCNVISLSHKSRAAICMAGKGGTPFWFDTTAGLFTTSQAYLQQLPVWVNAFNRNLKNTLHRKEELVWEPHFPADNPAYTFPRSSDYRFSGGAPLFNKTMPFTDETRFSKFLKMPQSVDMLLDMARFAVLMHTKEHEDQPLLLWISISTPDILGHSYGPESKEVLDMMYHIDASLKPFITSVEKMVDGDCAWVLTSDHGMAPMIEQVHEDGKHSAQRVDAKQIMADLNDFVYRTHNVKNLLVHFDIPYFYFDQKKWEFLSQEKQEDIAGDIRHELLKIPGILKVWTAHELARGHFDKVYGPHARETWFQKQHYHARGGQLACMVAPYTYLTTYETGSSHCTPYDYDVRVPLVVKAPHGVKPGLHADSVDMRYVAPTLAHVMQLTPPAHGPARTLPLK